MILTGKLDWSLENIRQLPQLSIGYVDEYMMEIRDHPEIYQQKALFLDLVMSLNKDEMMKIREHEERQGRSPSVIEFIKEELERNGTIEALRNGTISDFMTFEAKKEGYVSGSNCSFHRFGCRACARKINPDESDRYFEHQQLVKYLKGVGFITKDEAYDILIKSPYVQEGKAFPWPFFGEYVKDDKKSQEIMGFYNKAMQYNIDSGQAWVMPVDDKFLDKVLEAGKRDFALKILQDMAKYSGVENVHPGEPLPFVDVVSFPKRKKLFEKNNLQGEVDRLTEEYLQRPEVKSYMRSNRARLARIISFLKERQQQLNPRHKKARRKGKGGLPEDPADRARFIAQQNKTQPKSGR